MMRRSLPESPAGMEHFHRLVRRWFEESFTRPTPAQRQAWPIIANSSNTLLLAPTGSGKTLAAFLVAIDRLAFPSGATATVGVKTLYISPLKALGVDVARNLQAPIAGIRAVAQREGLSFREPTIGIRSGDTPPKERHRLARQPPDILITTPESLYLLLTSRARSTLAAVDTVIVDEIHALVANKRGAHLFLSLERLESLRRAANPAAPPLQRIGLSATQRPLDEVARLLGGAECDAGHPADLHPRPVEIVSAGSRKPLEITIEMPMDELLRSAAGERPPSESAARAGSPSLWPAIHPRLVELIRSHRSTMLFVNSRRLAERLAAAINELAESEIALAHHGSIAKDTRQQIEERLKSGRLPAIVATSSLELGIDMGAVDLVIQIEAPPSIAAGLQRIGRAGHQVGAASKGIVFPKFRGDLLACSAAAARMMAGEVEETFYPRNPLDVLAQQIVAMVASRAETVDALYATVRRAAPFHELPRSAFESVLDLLAGRYPSDEFAELRPRVTWDRVTNVVTPRQGAQRMAIANAGTIPDRGLYGVFLADHDRAGARVGELDEEMVFETHVGDVFLLGASSWRVLEITADRVLVAPAPGEPGRMPFWRGDGPGRPLEFGRAIGRLTRLLLRDPREKAVRRLTREHGLEAAAAEQLVNYVVQQAAATIEAPTDETIVVESFRDEVGDWRVVLLTPFGARVHAPWATATMARLRNEVAGAADVVWSDDGIAFRLPASDLPPPVEWLLPKSDEVESTIVRELSGTSLFAARFRENAGRALLLPRRQPGRRTPLWLQRRRAADLLQVVSRFPTFPILLETYRECLRDVFDLPGLKSILSQVERQAIRVRAVETRGPSPFAATLLFNYAGNFIYDTDTPLAERRAQALALDHAQLRQLLGDAELRELLDADTVATVARELQRLDGRYPLRHADDVHDLLLRLGDLSRLELAARCEAETTSGGDLERWLQELVDARRIIGVPIAGYVRFVAVEDAARYRDALGTPLPSDLPAVFLEPASDPLADLLSRYARTHGPFRDADAARRFGLGVSPVRATLRMLEMQGRVLEGEFLPAGQGREWCDAEVLRTLRRRSLVVVRKQIEPVDEPTFARFFLEWQGLASPRRGLDGLLDVIEQLQGLPLPANSWERDILPARVADFRPEFLDELCAAGEVVWRGCGRMGANEGRIALYLTDEAPLLAPAVEPVAGEMPDQIRQLLRERGALFFDDLVRTLGGFRNDLFATLWELVWNGEVTNDTLAPLRALRAERRVPRRGRAAEQFRSRRLARTPGSEGRWSLFERVGNELPTATERQTALVRQLLKRYGIVTRELAAAEEFPGGFAAAYPVLKAFEEAGRVRRGYFVAGLGAAQFAAPGADERLRRRPDGENEDPRVRVLAAIDPANPFGTALLWPAVRSDDARPQRVDGARVLLDDGRLLAYLNRTGQQVSIFPSAEEPTRSADLQRVSETLAQLATAESPVFLAKIDGQPPEASPLAERLLSNGFIATSRGYLHRRRR